MSSKVLKSFGILIISTICWDHLWVQINQKRRQFANLMNRTFCEPLWLSCVEYLQSFFFFFFFFLLSSLLLFLQPCLFYQPLQLSAAAIALHLIDAILFGVSTNGSVSSAVSVPWAVNPWSNTFWSFFYFLTLHPFKEIFFTLHPA